MWPMQSLPLESVKGHGILCIAEKPRIYETDPTSVATMRVAEGKNRGGATTLQTPVFARHADECGVLFCARGLDR